MEKQIRALFIGAHPDDCDFEGGGLALKYARAGHVVKFISVCDGSGGHHEMTPEETKTRRRGESRRVAEFIGIEYDVWDIPDCEIINDLENRKRITREIRKFNPDIVFCCRSNDYHADHRNCAGMVQDASYLLIVPHFCPDTPAMKQMPIILNFYDRFQNPPFKADVIIDIGDVLDDKIKMLSFHESQMFEWLPYTKGRLAEVPTGEAERLEWLHEPRLPEDISNVTQEDITKPYTGSYCEWRDAVPSFKYRDLLIKRYGEERGSKVRFSEAFAVCEYGRRMLPEDEKIYFPF